jgi:hypothetical protein
VVVDIGVSKTKNGFSENEGVGSVDIMLSLVCEIHVNI